jgi:DNA processing protein
MSRGLLLRELAANIGLMVDHNSGRRARDLLALDDERLAAAACPDGPAASAALGRARSRQRIGELRRRLAAEGCTAICRHDPGWPAEFSRLGEAAPRALFCRGDVGLLGSSAEDSRVTVIGARRASAYGREVAQRLAGELAASGIVVVSGLAFGIDTAAHEGALGAGGRTLAVLGTGPERAYPRSRGATYERIHGDGRGLVVSELPPRSPTFRWMFPARNRLMAALSGLTVVVEAAERSGSLITAEMAIEIGRQVGAVPGPVNSWRSQGTNRLLADGACLIGGAADVLDCLLGPGAALPDRVGPPLDLRAARVLDAVESGAMTPDSVAAACRLGAAEVAAALALLELSDYVRSDSAGRFRRTSLAAPAVAA